MAHTASDLFVERLMERGLDTVFGLPGDGINSLTEAFRTRQDRLRYVHVRHEEVGAMAAVGYARLTGKLGVCFATSGPGAIHLANGLLDPRLGRRSAAAGRRCSPTSRKSWRRLTAGTSGPRRSSPSSSASTSRRRRRAA